MSYPVLSGRRRLWFFLIGLFILAFFVPMVLYWFEIQNTVIVATSGPLSYFSTNSGRSIGAATPTTGPSFVVPHLYADGAWTGPEICELHGWSARVDSEADEREMWDALILDSPTEAELELLEIRLNELHEVVDKVFIIESNRTINGTPKGYHFNENRWKDRFAPFTQKIVYRAVPSIRIDSIRSPSPESWANRLRSEMNSLLRSRSSNTRRSPIVLFSDVDEVPSAHTIRLLRGCAFPSPLHLQMKTFLYSFEFPIVGEQHQSRIQQQQQRLQQQVDSWRAQVHVWDTGTKLVKVGENEARITRRRTEYSRELQSEYVLADAGWKCVYCFSRLEDLIESMQDEFGAEAAGLTPELMQEAVCAGTSFYDVLPSKYKTIPSPGNQQVYNASLSVPRYTIEAMKRYRHLFPGGCLRDTVVPEDEEEELVEL